MLTPRQEQILRLVVGEYVASSSPVASETITRKYGLAVSSATVRHELAVLEEQGYISHPHTSAGRIPTDQGYRYFIERLMAESILTSTEQRTIRHQFHQAEQDLEQWLRLAASVLAQSVRNAALVSTPQAPTTHLKHMQLISVQDRLALLVVVAQEGILKQQMLTLPEALTQDELAVLGNKLTSLFQGLDAGALGARLLSAILTTTERQVAETSLRLVQALDQQGEAEIVVDGVRHLMSQPEIAANAQKMRQLVEVLDDRSALRGLMGFALSGDAVFVLIGGENPSEQLRDYSLVLTRYGQPSEATGIVGVLGPTRMAYGRTISSVRYLSGLLGEFILELQGQGPRLAAPEGD